MVCFSGREGAGKSFFGYIMDSLIGGTAVHSESSQDQDNLVFGGFQEPLLYATQVFLEENDPKKLNGIISIIKDNITKPRYKINTKRKDLIHRLNCIQFWGNSNDLSTIDFTTTVRRFLAVKVLPDLIKGLIGDLDKYWEENFGYKFWEFGYEMMLKNEFCLKYMVADIHDTYEAFAESQGLLGGEEIDFQKTMPKCDHMTHAIKKNIKPIYPYLQKICCETLDLYKEYELSKSEHGFEYWYHREKCPERETSLRPTAKYWGEKKNFIGGWKIPIKTFREELNKYCREILDLGNGVEWTTKNIETYLNDLLNYKDKDKNLLTCQIGSYMCYVIKPQKAIELLKICNFYQGELETSKEEIVEEIFQWETEKLAKARAKDALKEGGAGK